MKFIVTAIRFNAKTLKQERYTAGIFDEYFLAELFKKAYQEKYHGTVEIIEI